MTTSLAKLTGPQKSALKWFKARSGDGMFDRTGCLIAAGERAGVMRSTWSILERTGFVERYANGKRLRITDQGQREDLSQVWESDCA